MIVRNADMQGYGFCNLKQSFCDKVAAQAAGKVSVNNDSAEHWLGPCRHASVAHAC